MNQQQQEAIVIECRRLALSLEFYCKQWLHTATNHRDENAGIELAAAADSLYTWINNHVEIMGSDTGKAAFDEFVNPDFQSDMQNLWDETD
jgi:hypothetical protein